MGWKPSSAWQRAWLRCLGSLALVILLPCICGAGSGWDPDHDDLAREFDSHARRAAPADGFPVFDEPRMASVARANRVLHPREWVIGVVIHGDARAYPVAAMGVHELGNDRVGGLPITVCW